MIHSICGLQNDGKTLYMTYLAYLDYLEGKPIISNYKLNFKHYLVNKDFMIWLGLKQPDFPNVTFVFDELWLWLDCRGMMLGKAYENTISTYFFLQSSKNSANIYLSAQHNSQNEIRIQNNLHRYTECERELYIGDNQFKRIISDKRNLGEPYNSYLYIKCKTYDRDLNIKESNYTLNKEKSCHLRASKYFGLYSTYEKKIIV